MALHGGDNPVSMEAMSRQYDNKLFDGVVKAFEMMRGIGAKVSDKDIVTSGLEKHVKKYTGLSVDFEIDRFFDLNAHMHQPEVDRNHPLNPDYVRPWIGSDDIKKIIKSDSSIDGTIDLKAGRVSGVYSDVTIKIVMGIRYFTSEHFTAEEVSALFLHEVGHAFSYFELLGSTIDIQHVMSGVLSEWRGEVDIPRRVELLSAVEDKYDLVEFDVSVASKYSNGELVIPLILLSMPTNATSGTDTRLYDFRTCEAMADQFVSRAGGAIPLATIMDKLNRMLGHTSYLSTFEHAVLQSVFAIISLPILPLMVMLAAISERIESYDNPVERFTRIRNDVVNEMKKPHLSKEIRNKLQFELDSLNDIIKQIKDKTDYFDFLQTVMSPAYRKGNKRLKMMQELEALSNNPLYAMANKLNTQT